MAASTTDETNNNSIKCLLSGWGLPLTGRPCDNCRIAASLLYCNTDTAFLCGPCDTKIHSPTCYPRHERVWVCEVCEHLPAVVTCKADAANLCSSCDHDIHSANPLASRHDRVPVIPFLDSPIDAAMDRCSAASSDSSAFLVPDNLDTAAVFNSLINTSTDEGDDDDADTWLIPNPNNNFLYNESDLFNHNYGCKKLVANAIQFKRQVDTKPATILVVDDDSNRNYAFSDSVVPSQSQGNTSNNDNNNSFAVNSDNNFVNSDSLFDNCFNIDFTQPNKHHKKNNNDSHLLSPFNYSVSSSDIGVVPDGSASSISSDISYSFTKSTAGDGGSSGGAPLMDREARVLRYREKRKNRKFQKTIRYASRKAYAETRPRVKGRFAKRTDSSETSEIDFAVDNGGYGVVPAF